MLIPREDLSRFLANCEPNQPLRAGDRRYVPLDKVRGSNGPTSVDDIEQMISLRAESCQLFTGFPGSGKTTELKRLKQRLEDSKDLPTHVVYVDFEEYIDVYSTISVADILRILAFSLERAAIDAEGNDPDKKPGFLERFATFFQGTSVELTRGEVAGAGMKIMLEFKNNPTFYKRAEEVLIQRFQSFAITAKDSMATSVLRLKNAPSASAHRVVVIADGLEKIQSLREEDREQIATSVEHLFANHASHLRLPCHVIYTFPLWLRFRTTHLGRAYDGEPHVLPMVKIKTQEGAPVEAGIACMEELVSKRADVQRIFGAEHSATLRELIMASGGYPRDLLRMMRNLIVSVRDFPAKPVDIERIIERLAETYSMALLGEDIDVLMSVAETHDVPANNPVDVAKFIRLVDRWLLLAYRNGKEWYDIHPMLRQDHRVMKRLRTS